jgi:2-(1,2-epoxy-1,2-dihydrophenyl)acetyl-CoA isomerase
MEMDTGTADLLARVQDRVAVFTLNRPDRRNAFSTAMTNALGDLLERVETDAGIGAVLLTGAGGAFSAGGDVKGFAAGSASAAARPGEDGSGGGQSGGGESGGTPPAPAGILPASFDRSVHTQRLNQRATSGKLYSLPKPTLAALPGPAAGAGLALALACDLRMAARGAVLTTAFAKVGFSGDYGGTWFLSRLVGLGKAKELYYLSERIDAEEACRLGIVNWVVEPDELEERAMELARRLANGPTVAYRYMKENLNRAVDGPLEDCMDLEVTHHQRCGLTEDHREAARAFVEKRPPVFRGR